jgi:hypothetical protein
MTRSIGALATSELQAASDSVMIVVEFIANQPSHDGYRRDGS